MKSMLICVMLALLGASCSSAPERPVDPQTEEIIASNPGMTEDCKERLRSGEDWGLVTYDVSGCFEMSEPERWKGLLNLGWEWSNFCAAPATECNSSSPRGDVWIEFAEGSVSGPRLHDGLYEVEFVGRRTARPGHFGHLSQYDRYMIVDRMISIRPVSRPK